MVVEAMKMQNDLKAPKAGVIKEIRVTEGQTVAAGDVLARLYPVPVALGMFKAWVRGATPNRLHMAQVGLEVLILTKRLDAVGEAKVRSDLQVLSQPST